MKNTTYTIARDKNGNKTLRVKEGDSRARSIQTNGNLPRTHRDGIGEWTPAEVAAYVGRKCRLTPLASKGFAFTAPGHLALYIRKTAPRKWALLDGAGTVYARDFTRRDAIARGCVEFEIRTYQRQPYMVFESSKGYGKP